MIYLVYSMMLSLGLMLKNNPIVKYILITYLFLIAAFNVNNPDYSNYESMYYFVGIGHYTGIILDFGYMSLVKIGNAIGLDYADFLIVYFLICTFFILKIVNLYSIAPNRVLSLILLYPLFINVIQIRSFLASLLIIYAFKYLLEFNHKNFIKFTLFFIGAVSLHLSSLIYGIFYLLFVKNKKIFSATMAILVMAMIISAPFLADILNAVSGGKLDSYAESNYITLNKVARVLFFAVTSIGFVYLLKYFNKKAGEFEYEELLTNAAILILLVSYAAIMASNEFERYARVGYILIYILFFNFISKRTIDINIRFLMTILFTLSMGSYIYFQYFFRASDQIPFFEAIFKTVLEYNSVIGIYNE